MPKPGERQAPLFLPPVYCTGGTEGGLTRTPHKDIEKTPPIVYNVGRPNGSQPHTGPHGGEGPCTSNATPRGGSCAQPSSLLLLLTAPHPPSSAQAGLQTAPPALDDASTNHAYLPLIVYQPPPDDGPIPPDDPAIEQYIAEQINQRRRDAGLPALTLNPALTQAARAHCHDMSGMDSPSHTGSDGSSPADRVEAAGYDGTYVGEIIAWGMWGSEDVVDWWMSSGPHSRMILSTWATEFGVGYVREEGSLYDNFWAVDFGRE